MHHKLLSSRLLGVSKGYVMDRKLKVADSPSMQGKKEEKEPMAEAHVPLNLGLAKIISSEFALDDEDVSKNTKKRPTASLISSKGKSKRTRGAPDGSSPTATKADRTPLDRPALFEQQGAPMLLPTIQTVKYIPAAPALANTSAAALLAARMAEEQEVLALYLRQRQQSNLQMELEQIRRIQTAMFLYQHTAPSAAASPYLESLIAGQSQAPLTLNEIFAHQVQSLTASSSCVAIPSQESKPKPTPTTAAASGATASLLNLVPKRTAEAMKDKPIKERPEEYQHLSKKARGTPLQMVFSGELHKVSGPESKRADCDDGSDTSDSEKNGHRFRPYQYEQWTEKFQELCDFRKVKGHCQVPHTYKDNPPLARWVKRQRYQYKLKVEGKMSTMTDERVGLLENIGFIWDSHAAAWAEKLHELKDYAVAKGDCNVPSTYPENPQLATWVKCQRRQYKLLRDGKTSNMTVDRIVELEKVGFVWEVRKTWDAPPTTLDRVVAAAAAVAVSNARQIVTVRSS